MEDTEVEIESIESGVSEGSSSEASESSSENGTPAQAAAPKQEPEIDWSKAFEHPRFKELVTDKNNYQKQYQDMESRYKALEQQLSSVRESQPKAPTETDQLIEDLKKVDPRLANVIESQLKAAKTAESVQARLESFEKQSQEAQRQQAVQTAVSKINQMHESNKVSPEIKQFINGKLDIQYMQGKLNLQNLEQVYKETLEPIKKIFDALKRSERESYVKEKTKDAGVPTSVPKGTQAKPAQKPLNVPKDKEALRAAVVKSFLKEQAATKEATNS